MKKLICLLVMMMFAVNVYAVVQDPKVTSNTVSFNTTGKVVTFNSVINHLLVFNDVNSANDVWVYINGDYIGWDSNNSGYNLPQKASYNSVVLHPGDSISADVNTKKIGFVGAGGSGSITWVATTDREQP